METLRLLIRPPTESDADNMLDICNSEYVLKFNATAILSKDNLIKEITQSQTDNSVFYLFLKAENILIGAVFIEKDNLRHKVNSVCISYFLKEEFAGKGYMTEALQQIIQYLFEEKKIDVISARVFAENTVSASLLKKLGFLQEGILRHAVCGYGEIIHDDIIFSLLKADFCK